MSLSARSQVSLHVFVFLCCVSFAIVMPTLWPYLHQLRSSKRFLAAVVALYSCGEAIGALLFGYMSSYVPLRRSMYVATMLGLIGSAFYTIAQPFPGKLGPILVLFARLLQGVWTGASQALQTVFLAKVLPPQALTPAIMALNTFACLGFVAGPIIGLAFSILPPLSLPGPFTADELTAPGYFVLLSSFVCIALVHFAFEPSNPEHGFATDESLPVTLHNVMLTPESSANEPLLAKTLEDDSSNRPASLYSFEKHATKLPIISLVLCNAIVFVHFFAFSLQETVTTPFVQTFYDWSVLRANTLFTVAGLLSLLAFALLTPLSRWLSDRALTASSVLLGAVGFVILTSVNILPVARFLTGFALISVAFPMGRATTVGLYTKLLPMHAQGTGQGVLLAVGALARIVGPFCAVRAVVDRNGALTVFGATAAAFLACLLGIVATYRRLAV